MAIKLLDRVLPMEKPRAGFPRFFKNTYSIRFVMRPYDYYFLCKWSYDVNSCYRNGGFPFRLFHFRRVTGFSNTSYLTRSPHAQTKYGAHVGLQLVLIQGYVNAPSFIIFRAFIRYLLSTFTVRDLVSYRLLQ